VSYAGGESETVIGRWLANRPSGVVVTTKAGGVVEAGTTRIDLSRDNLSRQLPVSLERLGLSSIDLYMTHAPDDETPIAETLEALAAFIDQGLVRSIGACNITDEQLRLALDTSDRLGLPRYEWVQNEYSLLARSDERTVMPLCAERGLGYTPHSPLSASPWIPTASGLTTNRGGVEAVTVPPSRRAPRRLSAMAAPNGRA
jgi:aryl-alcohol dehydrogenase-like predicted oxidoreductase